MRRKHIVLIVAAVILLGVFLCFSRGVLFKARYIYYHDYLYKDTGETVDPWGFEPAVGSTGTDNRVFIPLKDLEAANIPEGTVIYSRHFSDCEHPERLYILAEDGRMAVFRDAGKKLKEPVGYPSGTVQIPHLFYDGTLYMSKGEVWKDGSGLTEVGTVRKVDNTNLPDEEGEASRIFPGQKILIREDEENRQICILRPENDGYQVLSPVQ